MKVFADNLRQRAEALKLSNAEVARRAGLEERRYGNYVTGRREPDLATLLNIAEVLGCTTDELLKAESDGQRTSETAMLRERLLVASATLAKGDLERVVIQVEALAANKPST